jgi:hypothetical protein
MPTPDEIIESFRAAAGKETWTKQQDNPNALENAVQQLRDILNDNDPNSYSQKAFDFMEAHKGAPSVGASTCQTLFAKGDLGKAVATDVAKRVISAELGRYRIIEGGFIRGQHAINGLTKQFIQETSPDCERQVKEKVDAVTRKYGNLDQVAASNDWQAKSEITTRLGKDMLEVMSTTPLTQESVTFLKELRDTIEQDQGYLTKYGQANPGEGPEKALASRREIADIVVNNNAALRFASPLIRTNPTLGSNELWKDASGASLSTFSGARKDVIKPKVKHSDTGEGGKPKILTSEETAENSYLASISKGIHEERSMVLEMQDKLNAGLEGVNLTAQKFRESLELESGLKPRFEKIASMEKRLGDLNKTISVEKIKAWFSGKGVKGVKEELGSEIARTHNSIKESRGQLDTRFKNLKADQDYDKALDQLSKKQGLNPKDIHTALQMPGVNKALMEFAQKEHNAENLEFHQSVDDFKKLAASGASIEDLRSAAENIRQTYVSTGSPKEINISATERSKLEDDLTRLGQSKPTEQNFETWGPEARHAYSEVFNQSDIAVINLVKADTFKRFTADRSFKDAVTKSAEPPQPKVGQSTGIDQRNSLNVDGPNVGVKSAKVGVS